MRGRGAEHSLKEGAGDAVGPDANGKGVVAPKRERFGAPVIEKSEQDEVEALRAELRACKARLGGVQTLARVAWWRWDIGTCEFSCDEHFHDLLGISRELQGRELQQHYLQHVHPEDHVQIVSAARDTFATGEPYEVMHRYLEDDGCVRYFVSTGACVRDASGAPVAIEGTVQEVTRYGAPDRMKVEDQIRRQKEFIRDVIDAVPQLVFVKDREGHYILVNKATAELFGTTPAAMEILTDREAIPSSDEARLHHDVDQQVIDQGLTIEYSAVSSLVSDAEAWFRILKTPIALGDGAVGCLTVCTDVTEDRYHHLDILAARHQAERASRAKSEFLSVMSHEIRTPLNAVIGITHLLLQESPRADQAENLKVLRFSAETLLVLVNDILDYSKIEAGRVELEETELSLREIIEGIRLSLSALAEEKGIALQARVATDVPDRLLGDPVRIGQVLMNLVSNAVKFTPMGRVTVDVCVRGEREGRATLGVCIEDTGVGIERDHLTRIFDPFTQAQSSTTRRFGGTGLGLAITERLLKMYDSAITVESEPGRGSRFSFEIELKRLKGPPSGERATAQAPRDPSDLRGLRVLLAEDNEANVCIATKFLKRWGAVVDVAPNGLRAVEMARGGPYDVVLMDLQMPEMDGFEAASLIRADRADLPIVALTADAVLESRHRVFAVGMNDYLTKPFNPRVFFGKLSRYRKSVSRAPTPVPSLRPSLRGRI
jgi:PAS domain S-box-containing protein